MEERERDPRIDPQPGDQIARNIKHSTYGIILRKVERAHGGFVGFWADNGSTRKWKIIPLGEWQKWASNNSEVVDRCDDATSAVLSNSQVRPEQANAQSGAADNPGLGEL